MAMKCCTKLETANERCPIVFQGHPSNLTGQNITDFNPNWAFLDGRSFQIPQICLVDNYFIENKTMHRHNTRQMTNLHVTHPKSNPGKKSIKYYGAQEWNNIPLAIRKSSNPKSFNNQVKDLILQTYT